MKTYKIEGSEVVDLVRELEAMKERHKAETEALEKSHQNDNDAFFSKVQEAAGITDPNTEGDWYLDSSYVSRHKLLPLVKREPQSMGDLMQGLLANPSEAKKLIN